MLAVLFVAKIALGQAGTADGTGIVSDATGGVITGAEGIAINAEAGIVTKTTAGSGVSTFSPSCCREYTTS